MSFDIERELEAWIEKWMPEPLDALTLDGDSRSAKERLRDIFTRAYEAGLAEVSSLTGENGKLFSKVVAKAFEAPFPEVAVQYAVARVHDRAFAAGQQSILLAEQPMGSEYVQVLQNHTRIGKEIGRAEGMKVGVKAERERIKSKYGHYYSYFSTDSDEINLSDSLDAEAQGGNDTKI